MDRPSAPVEAGSNPVAAGRTFGVVLAAGSGRRYGALKQFQPLAGQALVDRALGLLREFCEILVLALPEGSAWPGVQDLTVTGGPSRLETLASALRALPGAGSPGSDKSSDNFSGKSSDNSSGSSFGRAVDVVVVHDCARPLARTGTVLQLIEAVRAGADAAVPAWEPPDVIKRRRSDGSLEHVGREGYLIVQSPYACALPGLRRALTAAPADVVEETEAIARLGGRVVAIPGDPWSHHIVAPRDLVNAGRLLARSEPSAGA